MSINSFKLLVAFLLTAASMKLVHAMPATDPNVDTPTKVHELVSRAAPPDRFSTNPVVATSAEAYTNCCQFIKFTDGAIEFTLNLAGWGNTNHKKNHTIYDDPSCAEELFSEIMSIGGVETMYSSICVPSYGALRDTFVIFNYESLNPTNVILALNNVVPSSEQWGCTNATLITDDSLLCKPQQLNI